MARIKHQKRIPYKKKFSIIVDGETEVWYFQLMKQFETLAIDIKPEIPRRKSLIEQFSTVSENAKHYDMVFWIVDIDTILKEHKETKKGQKTKIQEFKEYVEELKKLGNVWVLPVCPCFEFWILLHFEETTKFYATYDEIEKRLKNYLPDYEKTEKYYKRFNNDLYKILKPRQDFALANAKKLGDFDFENPYSAKCEIFKLFEFLLSTKKMGT